MREGKALMARGQYAAACAKIADSQRLAPSPKSLLELALCHEKEGKTASAFAELKTVVQQAEWERLKAVSKTAKAHIAQIEPRVSRITIKVPVTSETDGLEVTMDGITVSRGAWGMPQPADPGVHQVTASGPGRERWATTVRITGDGEQQSVQIPAAAPRVAAAPLPEPKDSHAEDPDYQPPPKAEESEAPATTASKPFAGYVLAGTGVVALGVGSYFGLRAMQRRRDSDAQCLHGCTHEGVELNDQAKTAAWVADIGIGVGLVSLSIGTYLLLRTPSAEAEKPAETAKSIRIDPELGPSVAGVSVSGAW
jgi:hypothetical protein